MNSSPSTEKLEIKMNADGSLYVPRLVKKNVENQGHVNAVSKC